MLVKNWMNKKLVTIEEEDSMQDAIRVLKENDIRMLPVIKKGKLTGVITDRDLKRASASDATTLDVYELIYLTSKIKIKHIMTKNAIAVPEDYTIEETAEVLLNHKISGAPVLGTSGELIGTITQSDLFRALISLTGLCQKGIQFAFLQPDQPGGIKELADIVRTYHGRIVSVLTSSDRAPEGYRKVYIRAYRIDREQLPALQQALAEKARLLYVVDHRDNQRQIFE